MTVSRVLRENPKGKAATMEKVYSACKALNYRQNLVASQLRHVDLKSRIIAVVLPLLTHSYFTNILKYFEEECSKYNFHVIIHQSGINKDVSLTWNDLDFLLSRHIDGLVIFGMLPREITDRLKAEKIPMVFIDSKSDDPELAFIGTKNYEGEKEITEYLIRLGHRKIAFIAGSKGHYTSDRRLSGYMAALKGNKLTPQIIHAEDMGIGDGFLAMNALLERGLTFTAVAAANDYLAMGVISSCAARKVRIPEDLSVTGFAGVEESAFSVPPLTTMVHQVKETGVLAFQMISGEMERSSNLNHREFLFPVSMMVRDSCAPPLKSE